MDYLTLLLLISFALATIHILISNLTLKPSKKLPPGPRSFPIIGNILELGTQPHRALTELSKIHGPIITLQLGKITTLVISSPELAKEVLHKHDQSFSSRTVPDTVRDHSELSVVWMPPSAQWRMLRRACATRLFSNRQLDLTQICHRRKVRDLLDFVDEKCRNQEALDIVCCYEGIEDLFVGGVDMTSITIEWAMARLLCNPDKLAKARTELDQALDKDEQLDESKLSKLPFLKAVVKETFCLHPPFPFLVPHKLEETIELYGFLVPKDAQILVNVWAMGRDSRIWNNPDQFLPERFLKSEIDFKGHNFELIPFGAGRRICLGLPLASRTINFVLGSLLLIYDLKLANSFKAGEMDMSEKYGITFHKAQPLPVIPNKV